MVESNSDAKLGKKRARMQEDDQAMIEDKDQALKDRKIVKVKMSAASNKLLAQHEGLDFEDSEEDEFENEDVVQRDSSGEENEGEWEDVKDDNESMSTATKDLTVEKKEVKEPKVPEKTEIWNDLKEPL